MMSHSAKFLLLLFLASAVVAENSGTFPEGFLFGAATSSYQIEGAWDKDGKGENIWDRFVHEVPSRIRNNDTGDVACDSYRRYKEDVAIVRALGLTHYRFSISWARILPHGDNGKIKYAGIRYYKLLVRELVKYNIQPVVTLYHWDLPQSLEDVGGLLNVSIVEHFVQYSRIVIAALPQVKYWVTFNEPKSICLYGYARGILAPGLLDNVYQCAYVLLKAHAETYHMYKKEFPLYKAPMALVVDAQWSEPSSNSTEDIEAAERRNQFETGLYLNPIYNGNWPEVVIQRTELRDQLANASLSRLPKFTEAEIKTIMGTSDYLGVNYYLANLITNDAEATDGILGYDSDVRAKVGVDPNWTLGYNNFPVVPWGFRKILNWIKERFNSPRIFITECGFSDDGRINDDARINNTRDYLNAMLDAMENDAVDIFGYTQWSLIDNFEWVYGFSQHFGLYSVNYTDPARARSPKNSAVFFKSLALTHKIPSVNFEEYCAI